jgi:hypothetical protein
MGLVRWIFCVLLCVLFCWVSPFAQSPAAVPVKLLDHLTGSWVLQGTIAGKLTTHDVQATWVLNREYVQLHEISREKNDSGGAAYEAIVYISWDVKSQQYTCLWLDSTAGGGLSAEGIARANLAGDSIPLIFTISPSDQIRTTFSYDKTADKWQWLIDDVESGQPHRFANVTLTRAKHA